MTLEQIRSAIHSTPFRPFTLHVADGRSVPVLSPEFMMPVPSGRTIIVCQQDDRVNIIDLLLVTDLEFQPNGRGARRRKRH